MKVYVTYCSKTKNEKLECGTPGQLYLAQRVQSFFNRFPGRKAILSYKYGIVDENTVIDNYEQDGFIDINKAAQRIKDFVKNDFIRDNELVFYSPRPLVEGPWIELLNLAQVKYSIIRSYKELSRGKLDLYFDTS